MLRAYEKARQEPVEFMTPEETYGDNSGPADWLEYVAKWAPKERHRPTIFMLDDGIRENAVGLETMRQSACNFLVLARRWSRTPWADFAWRLVKHWPNMVAELASIRTSKNGCKIEFSINGKPTRLNF
jgi:hypothetical protein